VNARDQWAEHVFNSGRRLHGDRLNWDAAVAYVSGCAAAGGPALYNGYLPGNPRMGWQTPEAYTPELYQEQLRPGGIEASSGAEICMRIAEAQRILEDVQLKLTTPWQMRSKQRSKIEYLRAHIDMHQPKFDDTHVFLAWELARALVQEDLDRICGR
jgi:hypothetical protein